MNKKYYDVDKIFIRLTIACAIGISLILVTLLSGCIGNDVHLERKQGIVSEIRQDVIFGATFTDWRNEIHFEDGTVLWIEKDEWSNRVLDRVMAGEVNRLYLETNFFWYEGREYKFYKLLDSFRMCNETGLWY